MKNYNKIMKAIGDATKIGISIVISVALVEMANKAYYLVEPVFYHGDAIYDDVVRAIMNSNMYSSYKTEALEIIKRDRDSTYYKTAMHILRSNMYDSYKIDALRGIDSHE